MRQTFRLLPLLCLAGCLTAQEPDVEAPPPAGMAGIAVERTNVFNMLASPAKLAVNGAEVRTLAVTDDYLGSVPPGQVVLTVSSLSGGRYSYRFTANAGKTYHFIITPRENITADGLAAGPGQAIETSGPFGIAWMN